VIPITPIAPRLLLAALRRRVNSNDESGVNERMHPTVTNKLVLAVANTVVFIEYDLWEFLMKWTKRLA